MTDDLNKKRRHHLWVLKLILAVFLIGGIMFLLSKADINTPLGSLEIPGLDMTSGLGSFFNPAPTGEGFQFSLTADDNLLLGSEIKISNGLIEAKGIHNTDVQVGNSIYEVTGKSASVLIDNFKGTVKFDGFGTLIVKGQASAVTVGDGVPIRSNKGALDVQMNLEPSSFTIGTIYQNKLVLPEVYGRLERQSGEVATYELEGTRLEISRFVGTAGYGDDGYTLDGFSTQIKGASFVWK